MAIVKMKHLRLIAMTQDREELLDALPAAGVGAVVIPGVDAASSRSALALAVFQERGLIALSVQGDQVTLSLNPIQGKVDLFACPYLSRLREDAAGKSGGVVS